MQLDMDAVRYIIETARLAGFLCQSCQTHEMVGENATVTLRFLHAYQPVAVGPSLTTPEPQGVVPASPKAPSLDTLDD